MEKKKQIVKEESSFDFKTLFQLCFDNWKWFLVSIIACVLLAGLYLWFTPTTVKVTGKMEIIDKSKNGSTISAGMAMLNNLPLGLGASFGGAASLGIDSEKEILLSNVLVRNVVKELDLFTEYRLCKWGRKTLLYQDNPISVSLDPAHVQWLDDELPLTTHQFNLTITKSDKGYKVETTLKDNNDKTDLPDQTFNSLPATIKTDAGILTLTEKMLTAKQALAYEEGYTLEVKIMPPSTSAESFIERTKIEPPTKKVANLLNITLNDKNVIRGIDFVNHLVEAYNKRANDEKNEEARKTDEFVKERLVKIDAELGSSDAAWEESKKKFQITAPDVDAQEVMTRKGEYEAQLVSFGTQIQLQDYLNDYINDPNNLFELIPVNVGVYGGDALPMVSQHNSLVTHRRELLKSVSEQSPLVQKATRSIQELHPNIKTAMQRDRQSLLIKRQTVEREYNKYLNRVTNAPQQERVLTEIGRQREIKQGVYLLMLQKREETAMDLANTTNKGRLVDETTMVKNSKTPQKKMVLLGALFFGAVLPLVVFYLFMMFKKRIDTLEEAKAATKLPILGVIPLSNSDEALHNLRTSLLLTLQPDQKTILVASNANGDGKTFIAQHLADLFEAIGKNCLYLNADLRNSDSSNSWSKNTSCSHPADYLASPAFAQQIAEAKSSHDYIILDSPALADYSDAYQLATFADATLFIVKSGVTKKSVLESLKSDSKLPNPLLVLNATK